MRKSRIKTVGLIVIILLALFVIKEHLLSFSISGIQLLGMSQVNIISNYNGTPGPWFIATAILGGSQQIYSSGYGQPAQITTSASTLASANSSYVGSSQIDTIDFKLLQNDLIYPTTLASGAQVKQYVLETARDAYGNPLYLTFTTCGGLSGQTITVPTNINYTENCWTLFGIGGAAQAIDNYEQACIDLSNATVTRFPLITSSPLPNGGTLQNLLSQPITLGCFQFSAQNVGSLYETESPIYNSTVEITVNNDKVILNSLNRQTNQTPDGDLIATYINNQPSIQAVPVGSFSVVQFYNGSESRVVNYVSPSQLTSIYLGINSYFAGVKNESYDNALTYIRQENGQIAGLFYNQSGLTGQFQNAKVIYNNGAVQDVIVNDSNAQYSRPEVQILVKAQSLGLYLAVSSIKIVSFYVSNFSSGSTGLATLVVQNNGTASGGYTAQLINIPSGVSVSGGQEQQTIAPGQSATFYWSLSSSTQNLENLTQNIGVEVCQTYGNKCVQTFTQFVQGSVCNNNAIYCNPQTHNQTQPVITPTNGTGGKTPTNSSSSGGGGSSSSNNSSLAWILLLLVIVGFLAYLLGRKPRAAKPRVAKPTAAGTAPAGKSHTFDYVVLAFIAGLFIYMAYIGFLAAFIILLIILGALYLISKILHLDIKIVGIG